MSALDGRGIVERASVRAFETCRHSMMAYTTICRSCIAAEIDAVLRARDAQHAEEVAGLRERVAGIARETAVAVNGLPSSIPACRALVTEVAETIARCILADAAPLATPKAKETT